MRRIAFGIIGGFTILTLGGTMLPSISGAADNLCCETSSSCHAGLQAESCCEIRSTRTTERALSSVWQPAKISTVHATDATLFPKLACGKNPPRDSAEPPPEQESLYLLKATFLI